MDPRMKFDDVAWERSDDIFAAWKEKLLKEETLRALAAVIKKYRGGVPKQLYAPQRGAYNVTIRLLFVDGGSALMRIPCPGVHMFPEEKVRKEVAVMKLVSERTTIPIPFVLHHGMADECPENLGPFIIMEWVENAKSLSQMLNLPGLTLKDRPVLNPRVDEEKLKYVYEQVADILLQLSTISFDRIGAPFEVQEDVWMVTERPLTFDMNELIQLANCPRAALIQSTFDTTASFYNAIADMKIMHLDMQHNDAIDSEEDCRRKYIGRHLYKKLATEQQLHNEKDKHGPFRLWCDDLRPGNILVDDNCRILSVIDWEFAYTAPPSYTYNPPWWLLLETPEYWFRGIEDWVAVYEPRMDTFVQTLKKREDVAIERGTIKDEDRLSQRMKQNWESGQFWVDYAARRSWAFDSVFWTFIDKIFYGGNGKGDQFEKRLELLGEAERRNIEAFVAKKIEESKTRTLREWDS